MTQQFIDDGDDEENLFDLYHSSGNARDQTRPAPPDEGPEAPPLDTDGMEVHDLLVMGRKLLLQRLLEAVNCGYASPQEMAILAKLLKDNGMVMGDPFEDGQGGASSAQRRAPLPTFGKPDYEP